ncbi:hypothetical protein CRYUN_Cryun03dG0118300 [Craigia yunnanensis]
MQNPSLCLIPQLQPSISPHQLLRKLNLTQVAPRIYCILCESLAKSSRGYEAIEYFRDMTKKGIFVSSSVYSSFIRSFASIRDLTVIEELFKEAEERRMGYKPGQVTYASIINAYCRIGLNSKAEMVFSEMEQKGFDKCVVACSSLIVMYGNAGRIRDAVNLVAKMKQKGCQPNVWIYNSLIDMHVRVKNLR